MVKALYGKQPEGMNDMDWKDLEAKAATTIRLCLGSDLSQHINVFNQIISDLKRIDVKFEDEDKALMLLNFLPAYSTYENLVTTLMWGKETLDLDEITSVLLGFNQRKKANDESSQGEGLVAKSNHEHGRDKFQSESSNNKSRSKSKKRKDIQCYKCGKRGHMK
ncbi:hypothetical protein PVL29_018140 [Vitis rotundifolia]|uniref:Retrovirus-related Pol polyprotein from transposon TNT 1-94 n=1 Tax=Vitis rotundifolia TaxID=103349 RepID=A0AA39DFS8_VITRO|nr:hypothetical protein PVL29_018140 [Vitis rotundifolia]